MSTRPNESDVNERATATRAAPPRFSSFSPVADLNLKLKTRLRAFDEELLVDPQTRVETMVQTFSRALGFAAPIAALLVLLGALSVGF
jgi:hypothetical protein